MLKVVIALVLKLALVLGEVAAPADWEARALGAMMSDPVRIVLWLRAVCVCIT